MTPAALHGLRDRLLAALPPGDRDPWSLAPPTAGLPGFTLEPVLVVAGSRRLRATADDRARFAAIADAIGRLALRSPAIHVGDAGGFDEAAAAWATGLRLRLRIFCAGPTVSVRRRFPDATVFVEATWRDGRSAGPIRNRSMTAAAAPAGLLVAWPGGPGTGSAMAAARSAGLALFDLAHPAANLPPDDLAAWVLRGWVDHLCQLGSAPPRAGDATWSQGTIPGL